MKPSNVADSSPFGNVSGDKNSSKNGRNWLEIVNFIGHRYFEQTQYSAYGEEGPLLNYTASSHMQAIPCHEDPVADCRS